jgi:hypothetical protein
MAVAAAVAVILADFFFDYMLQLRNKIEIKFFQQFDFYVIF